MLAIGKSKKPRAFKNCTLPLLYKGQARGWMNVILFKEWFHDEFVPSMRKHLESKNLEPKAILLLDNCPGHPDECDLVSDDGKITAMFFSTELYASTTTDGSKRDSENQASLQKRSTLARCCTRRRNCYDIEEFESQGCRIFPTCSFGCGSAEDHTRFMESIVGKGEHP
jgi:hypothetical protein